MKIMIDNFINPEFDKYLEDVIKVRHSVRNYEPKELIVEDKEKVKQYLEKINNTTGIFGGKIRVTLIETEYNNENVKLGTYGVVRGAKDYLSACCKKDENSFYDLGFLFEKVILYCTSIGLGTVWLGGTFNKSGFARKSQVEDDEIMPIVSPVGYEGGAKTILGKLFSGNTNKRKHFQDLFFNEDFRTQLNKEEAGRYYEILEMVRLAPSSLNSQPWRILKQGNSYHIYSAGKNEMNKIDMGIALCHFYLCAEEADISGEFKVLDDKENDKFKYVVSWIEK